MGLIELTKMGDIGTQLWTLAAVCDMFPGFSSIRLVDSLIFLKISAECLSSQYFPVSDQPATRSGQGSISPVLLVGGCQWLVVLILPCVFLFLPRSLHTPFYL